MVYTNELYHHGIKGQRWGIRRYRNEDGSLTPAGKKREAQLEKYRQSELQKVEKRYGRAEKAAEKKERKLEDAYVDAYAQATARNGGNLTPKQKEIVTKYLSAKMHRYEAVAKRAAETTALKNMTVDELEKDRRTVRQKQLGKTAVLAALGAASIAAPIDPVYKAIGAATSLLAIPAASRSARYEARISKEQDDALMKGAMKKAGVSSYSRGGHAYEVD